MLHEREGRGVRGKADRGFVDDIRVFSLRSEVAGEVWKGECLKMGHFNVKVLYSLGMGCLMEREVRAVW